MLRSGRIPTQPTEREKENTVFAFALDQERICQQQIKNTLRVSTRSILNVDPRANVENAEEDRWWCTQCDVPENWPHSLHEHRSVGT